ncbi:unnamed protein product [Rhizophagus irregularis]|uniref:Uncharacterized protein n=1 Tax=Rhizophagus irregularis TaxID=588596 RepID=A0A2N1MZP3_9GLOM|nr:hypothetical protein RhiirC2_752444 [Rhizophagus irregularis]CAB4382099.1 unnamed protein product [Rhizophagus irregularis]CAB5352218.1 unnamed protein product [Rhizophagus irregularis]
MSSEVVKKIKEEVKDYKNYECDFKWVSKKSNPKTDFTSATFKGKTGDFDAWVDKTFPNHDKSLKDLMKSMGLCDESSYEDWNVSIEDGSVDAKYHVVAVVKKDETYYVGVGKTLFSVKNTGDYFLGNDTKVVNALKYHYYDTKGK